MYAEGWARDLIKLMGCLLGCLGARYHTYYDLTRAMCWVLACLGAWVAALASAAAVLQPSSILQTHKYWYVHHCAMHMYRADWCPLVALHMY